MIGSLTRRAGAVLVAIILTSGAALALAQEPSRYIICPAQGTTDGTVRIAVTDQTFPTGSPSRSVDPCLIYSAPAATVPSVVPDIANHDPIRFDTLTSVDWDAELWWSWR